MSKYPVLTLSGYETSPGIDILHELSPSSLKSVVFSIHNQHGSIHFLFPVDLTDLNLDEILEISQSSVVLYKTASPALSTGLNVPAKISLNSYKHQSESHVKSMTEKQGVIHK